VTLAVHDILKNGPYLAGGRFDAAFSLDVVEHIPEKQEDVYVRNIAKSLTPNGVFICGSPSIESQPYASPMSKEGHINCKSGKVLQSLLKKYFHNAFLFGMNDEVLHTGFAPMCHYLFVLAVGPIDS
jgi:2-polyprenyl-3-methyl-5-hydroxy-6-metoxy-1,4-benzoquinol methylase